MLKKTITYTDFNGKPVTEDFYFNLTKAELIELEVSAEEGFAESLQQIVTANNGRLIIDSFKRIILMSYGQKSPDGRRFIKSDEMREEFSQTEAFSDLFVELATDGKAAAAFVNAVVPKALGAELSQTEELKSMEETPAFVEVALPLDDIPEPIEASPASLSDDEIKNMSPEEIYAYERNRRGITD